jgi:hypothetical protein
MAFQDACLANLGFVAVKGATNNLSPTFMFKECSGDLQAASGVTLQT